MWFFASLYNSLYNIGWLRKQKDNPNRSWSYFFLFAFLITGITLIPVYINVIPPAVGQVRTFINEKMPDFSAELKNGQLTVDKLPQPFVAGDADVVFVVDTVSTGTLSVADFMKDKQQAGILITKDRLEYIEKDKNQGRTQYFKDMGDFSTDRDKIVAGAGKWLTTPMIVVFCALLFIGFFIFLSIGKIVSLLFWGFVIWLSGYITKKEAKYMEIINAGLFAVTLPTLVMMGLDAFGVQIRFAYSLIWMFLVGMVFFGKIKADETVK